ncbi:uncharacterized protein LOC141628271 [Silene latifolia]|uniref:uncharacterized protein LOC141628271 n=1 Tax=Silene latifolia TaxID=37657 RepID=UPI003D77C33A
MSTLSSSTQAAAKKTGPCPSEVLKEKNVNEVVGIAPYDLDAVGVVENTEEWVVQGKKNQSLAAIPEDPKYLQFTAEDVVEELNYWKSAVYCRWKLLMGLSEGYGLISPLISWTEKVEFTKDNVKTVLVWVRLMDLPLKFWGKCLPRISELAGKYIRSDVPTMEKTRLGFALVLLEVPFGAKVVDSVKFLDEEGQIVKIRVECEWRPILCTECGGVGHEGSKCRKPKPKGPSQPQPAPQKWVPKKVTHVRQKAPTTEPGPSVVLVTDTHAGITLVTTPEEVQHKLQVTWPPITFSRQEIIKAGKNQSALSQYTFQDALNNATPKVGISNALPNVSPRVGVGTSGSVLLPTRSNVGLFGLLETKVKPLSLNSVRLNMCDGWSLSTNTSYHSGGRIWVLWNPSVFHVQFLYYSAQLIHMEVVEVCTQFHFYYSMVYAFNDTADMKSLWADLNGIASTVQGPWMICGDFNCVLSPAERLGGHTTEEEMSDFQDCLDQCQLFDSPAAGSFYTWNNKQDP